MKASLIITTATAMLMVGVTWVGAQAPKLQQATNPTVKSAAKLPSLFPIGYFDYEQLSTRLQTLASTHPKVLELRTLATTKEGRAVWLMAVGHANAKGKPSVLITANLESDHIVGSQVTLGLIESLAQADGKDAAITKLLDERMIYFVPRLNPDGAERALKTQPRFDIRGNLTSIDRDRDGKQNEDGPNDLDKDGFALTMRVKDSKATLIPDEKDPRILRKADVSKGEKAVYSEQSEGIDDDNDGAINEDPIGGVNLNRNFPHGWTEYNVETGYTAASEIEVNALLRFAFAHPEIGAIWTFSLNDNLKTDAKGIAPGDVPIFAELTRQHNKISAPKNEPVKPTEAPKPAEPAKVEVSKTETPAVGPQRKGQGRGPGGGGGGRGSSGGPPSAPVASAPTVNTGVDGTTDGAMNEWAYQQFGVIGLASRLWSTPEDAAGEGEARWLDWNDKIMQGTAFVPFHTIEHPSLGKVEVGGWKPGVRVNPPIELVPKITEGSLAFLKELASRLPVLELKETKVENKGGGVFEITATVQNTGYLPTALAQGLTTRKAAPVLVKLGVDKATLLAGRVLNRIDTLAGSGGAREFRWLILAPEDLKSVTIDVNCPKAGAVHKDINLR